MGYIPRYRGCNHRLEEEVRLKIGRRVKEATGELKDSKGKGGKEVQDEVGDEIQLHRNSP